MTPLLRSGNIIDIAIQSYIQPYKLRLHQIKLIPTNYNSILILILTVPQIKRNTITSDNIVSSTNALIMNLHQCIAYWYSFVISPNNTLWYLGGRFICEFLQNSHLGRVFKGRLIREIGLYATISGISNHFSSNTACRLISYTVPKNWKIEERKYETGRK